MADDDLQDRINRAATVANWNTDERKITEFYLTLRDKAILWWDTLEDNAAIDRASWADIQKEFLAAYAPRFTARTTCTNFQDLIQRNGENVHDYYLRVSDAFKKMCEAKHKKKLFEHFVQKSRSNKCTQI